MKIGKYKPDFTQYNTGEKKVKLWHVHYIGGTRSGNTNKELQCSRRHYVETTECGRELYEVASVTDRGTHFEAVYFLTYAIKYSTQIWREE